MFGGFGSTTSTFGSENWNVNRSVECQENPSDSVSDLAWFGNPSGGNQLLACASWDKTVRVWEVNQNSTNIQLQAKQLFTVEAPLLGCCFGKDGVLFSGGCDQKLRMHNIQTGQSQEIGTHDAPISQVCFDPQNNVVATGSWDSSVRFWDGRSSSPVMTKNIGSKVYAMDVRHPVMVVGAADRQINCINLMMPQNNPVKMDSLLRLQYRAVSIFPDGKGFAIGSVEGRCNILHLDTTLQSRNFVFKCHRVGNEERSQKVYPVNDIDFHPQMGTFVTAGGDGGVVIWDKDNKMKLKAFDLLKVPITRSKFSPSGTMLAYSMSYDWHKGYSYSDPAKNPTKVFIHLITEDFVRPKKNMKR